MSDQRSQRLLRAFALVALPLAVVGCSPGPVTAEALRDAPVTATAPGPGSYEFVSGTEISDRWTIELRWGDVEGASGYEVQVRDDHLDGWRTIDAGKTLTSPNSQTRTTYFGFDDRQSYRVRAVFEDRTVSKWSRPFSVPIPATNVLYEVEGTAAAASVTMSTPTGTEQVNINLPMTTKSGKTGLAFAATGDMHLYLSAQNTQRYGTVTCRITLRGTVVSENTSSGGYTIVTCSP